MPSRDLQFVETHTWVVRGSWGLGVRCIRWVCETKNVTDDLEESWCGWGKGEPPVLRKAQPEWFWEESRGCAKPLGLRVLD